jgi:hypothetical protein
MLVIVDLIAGIVAVVMVAIAACLELIKEEHPEKVMYYRLPIEWLIEAAGTDLLLARAERVLDRC